MPRIGPRLDEEFCGHGIALMTCDLVFGSTLISPEVDVVFCTMLSCLADVASFHVLSLSAEVPYGVIHVPVRKQILRNPGGSYCVKCMEAGMGSGGRFFSRHVCSIFHISCRISCIRPHSLNLDSDV